MEILLTGGHVYRDGCLEKADVLIEEDRIAAVGQNLATRGGRVVDATGCVVSPGFCDLHVHLRQPGFEHKENISTGTKAAAAGGFTTVCAMPNLDPVPDSAENLHKELRLIHAHARVRVLPYGAITVGEKGGQLAEMERMAEQVIGFTDDGRGVQDADMMRRAMEQAAALDRMIAAHCEREALLPPNGVCVQAGSAFAQRHGFEGYSTESEWAEVERDIALSGETGCHLHICHASTLNSFTRVREAKHRGLRVTCEVTPHNLLINCDDIPADDGRYKMNPPLRTLADCDAALAAALDGTVDAIATDHAPHTVAEKQGGFRQALNGVVGLETAFPALYTVLVGTKAMGLARLLELLTDGPRRVLGEPPARIEPGEAVDLTVLDLARSRRVDPEKFYSKGRATPFDGWELTGWPLLTMLDGRIVFERTR